MEIQVVVELPATPTEVWSYLADVTKHSEWMMDALSVDITSEVTEGLGLTFDCLNAVGSTTSGTKWRLLNGNPNGRWA